MSAVDVTFDEFVVDAVDGLLRYATALTCDPHLAQDVVQESLLRASQRWPRISAMASPSGYVTRMVTNEYLSWRRRKASREVALEHATLDSVGPPTADPSGRYDEQDAMLASIAALPRKQRAAIVLRYYEGYDDDEIAEVLGSRPVTVRSSISRALATLRAVEPAALSHGEPR